MIPLITFGLGVFFTLFTGVIRSRVSSDVSSIAELTADISRVEELAVEYWSRGGRDDEDLVLEARIHGALNATRYFEADRICGMHKLEFRGLDAELAEEITGGAFETSGKAIDLPRITAIIEVSHRLRALLRTIRRAQYWAK